MASSTEIEIRMVIEQEQTTPTKSPPTPSSSSVSSWATPQTSNKDNNNTAVVVGGDERSVTSAKSRESNASSHNVKLEQKSMSFIESASKEIQDVMKQGKIVLYIVDLKKKVLHLETENAKWKKKDARYKRALKKKDQQAVMNRLQGNAQKNEDELYIEQLQEERDDFELQKNDLERICNEQTMKIDQLERTAMSKRFDDRQTQKAEESRHTETKSALEELQLKYEQLQTTCDEQVAEIRRFEETKAQVQAQTVATLETAREEQSKTLDELEAERAATILGLQHENARLHTEVGSFLVDLEQERTKSKSLSTANSELTKQNGQLRDRILELEQKVEEVQTQQVSLEKGETESMQTLQAQHAAAMKQLKIDGAAYIRKIQAINAESILKLETDHATNVQGLEAENARLHAEVGTCLVDLEEQRGKVRSLAAAIEQLKGQKEQYKEEVQKLAAGGEASSLSSLSSTSSSSSKDDTTNNNNNNNATTADEKKALQVKCLEQEEAMYKMQEDINRKDAGAKQRMQTMAAMLKESEAENKKLAAKCAYLEKSLNVFTVGDAIDYGNSKPDGGSGGKSRRSTSPSTISTRSLSFMSEGSSFDLQEQSEQQQLPQSPRRVSIAFQRAKNALLPNN